MRRRAAAARLLALVGVLAAAGCGAGQPATEESTRGPGSTSSSTAPEEKPTGGQESPGPKAEDLAKEAEELSKEPPPGEQYDGHVLGGDVSWPQCPKGMGIPEKRTLGMPMPLPEAEYVVIGLTNGPGFVPNPCLADQVSWVRERGLLASAYAVASYPDSATVELWRDDGPFDESTSRGELRNTGYQQAQFNVASMEEAGLETPIVWIDVEPVPDFPWSSDLDANAAVVQGAARGYVDAGYRIGVYSTPYLWAGVVGDLALGLPEWRAAGATSRAEALRRCGDDWVIQGGEAVLGQWVEADRDQNVTCPGISSDMTRWFHRYRG